MQASASIVQETNVRDGKGTADQTLRTVEGKMTECFSIESGGPYLRRTIVDFIRREKFICGCGRKTKDTNLSPSPQSTLAVIVASVEECSQQFVVPECGCCGHSGAADCGMLQAWAQREVAKIPIISVSTTILLKGSMCTFCSWNFIAVNRE